MCWIFIRKFQNFAVKNQKTGFPFTGLSKLLSYYNAIFANEKVKALKNC